MARPRSLWIVGVASLLWNAFGAVDYLMTQTANEAYLSGFTPEQRAYFDAFPPWAEAAWALGVWGGVAGALLLLLASRFAWHAFVLSFFGMAAGMFYQFALSRPRMDEVSGAGAIALGAGIAVVAILLMAYSARMKSRGYLR